MQAGDYRFFDTRFAAMAHRGGFLADADRARENTLYAFTRAVDYGYRYLETDAHVSADGVLFSFHDSTLDRVTDATGVPERLPWHVLQQARVAGIDPIPTFDELLETLPTARFNIDLKVPQAIEPLVRTIDAHNAYDRVCVGSFSSARIRTFRRLTGDRVATAAGPLGVAWQAYAGPGRRIARSAGVVLQIPARAWGDRVPVLSPGLIRTAHAAGRAVHVWTINDRAEMERLIDAGVDGLVSDRIEVLAQVLAGRGLWEHADE
ncbi:MAG: glycerophosphodiester phosphodiesterase family protein [Micropruina sp.]|uniref:glycerophosphodiester phosphodiesterase family protein n=1 Tax=Micropruina sp. TaxID=2737536 RepID=UPI0039E23096